MTNRLTRGRGMYEFTRLAALETDECVEWPYSTNEHGYGQVWDSPNRKMWKCHRLALLRRSEPPWPDAQALHGPCHNPRCMNYRHLYWGTRERNMGPDRLRDGTSNRGSSNGQAKLTEEQVSEIKALLLDGRSGRSIAAQFGVSPATVSMIKNGRTWRAPASGG